MDTKLALKIKKLLALAADGCSPEESASALAKAQDLMTRHKITQACIEGVDESDEEPIHDFYDSPLNEEDENKNNLATWKWCLTDELNKHNGCYAFVTKGNIILVGKASDVNSVRYLYEYCRREIDRLTKNNCRGYGRTYANNFRLGCVDAIRDALKKEREQLKQELYENNNERGLAVLDKVLVTRNHAQDFATEKYKLKNGSGSSWIGSANARDAGRQAGAGIYKGKRSGALPGVQKKLN